MGRFHKYDRKGKVLLTAAICLFSDILDLHLEVLIHHGECLSVNEQDDTVNSVVLSWILFVPRTPLDEGFPRQL